MWNCTISEDTDSMHCALQITRCAKQGTHPTGSSSIYWLLHKSQIHWESPLNPFLAEYDRYPLSLNNTEWTGTRQIPSWNSWKHELCHWIPVENRYDTFNWNAFERKVKSTEIRESAESLQRRYWLWDSPHFTRKCEVHWLMNMSLWYRSYPFCRRQRVKSTESVIEEMELIEVLGTNQSHKTNAVSLPLITCYRSRSEWIGSASYIAMAHQFRDSQIAMISLTKHFYVILHLMWSRWSGSGTVMIDYASWRMRYWRRERIWKWRRYRRLQSRHRI